MAKSLECVEVTTHLASSLWPQEALPGSPQLQPRMTSPAFNSTQVSAAALAWTYGWAISRHTQAPVQHAGYLQVSVGKPEQLTRYVLPRLDRELLHRLVSTEAAPGTWLKICAPLEQVAPLLSEPWQIHDPEFLMMADLAADAVPDIEGYRVHTEAVGALVIAKLVDDRTGELAASGQAALDGLFATFDQIVTAETHRRKGLGRCVMAALSKGALDLGAKQGVLVATQAGAALYTALGWSLVAPVTAASLPVARTDA
ncbi:GNAT family N-acetyltransferase [Roseateles sp. DAIF2]|uniref:GNAT family N-acetyltransferase n=1 Tax=Roseateles sp. DAIF2 TaxID=2714952 RepID=UPI0018A2BF8B|nr:GNAT family N-acetyltransferase [Roseateles sp. DAIF2]QPF75510.1 GNAT family N-acetyltransferase [Roseateles sp. DAIF2]